MNPKHALDFQIGVETERKSDCLENKASAERMRSKTGSSRLDIKQF
ncbi:hypothetical protein P872_20435 [Rhodonellum psychrophilum GCM71 = DSM 17998]|uniref:Uncharacterized protein n=1 Tax=Rhodonellum psychrophilum GCM71 = DSM 17998 TaxID=1123057 RepID=U5BTB3_9BACT|nr:hypothetical protein P872_20435 [Rhodonellum psychrophilum GCM71 = DSM 17998]